MFIVPMHIRLPQRHYGLKWLRSPWGDRCIGFCLGHHLCEVHLMRGLPPSSVSLDTQVAGLHDGEHPDDG